MSRSGLLQGYTDCAVQQVFGGISRAFGILPSSGSPQGQGDISSGVGYCAGGELSRASAVHSLRAPL